MAGIAYTLFSARLIFGALLAANVETIYIVPLSHADVGFTAPPSEVAQAMTHSGEDALARARADSRFVWNFETFWQFEQWLDRTRDPAPILDLIRAGRFGLGAAYANAHTSLMSDWALDRLFGVGVDWGRAHGVKLDWAIIDDVPGHPIDLPRYLSRNGVRYLALGVNQSLSPPLPEEICDTPFWWEGPGGERVLTWISADSYTEAFTKYGVDPASARLFNSKDFGKGEDLEVMRRGVGQMKRRFASRDYAFDAVLALHGFDNWGSRAARRLPDAADRWNQSEAPPRLALSTPREFFEHIENRYGSELPVRRGGFGGQWEPVRTGTPTATGRARAEELRLRASADPDPDAIRRLLVFWEHSFGMGPPWPRLLTRVQALAHNREQAALVAGWPAGEAEPFKGEPLTLNAGREWIGLRTNALYEMKPWLGPFAGRLGGELSPRAWPLAEAVRVDESKIVVRHRIDRRQLGREAHIVWAWKLREADKDGPVVVKTASGEFRPETDGLAGYKLDYWIAPAEFRVGSAIFRPHGPFAFTRPRDRPGWLLAKALDQSLSAEFKDKGRASLTFEQAYPGEEPIYEFSIEIESAPSGP